MANVVSSWSNEELISVPENYIFPPEKRPGSVEVPLGKSIPIVNLNSQDRSNVVEQILQACKEYGFFQVVNHGVWDELMDETLCVMREFHMMPAEEKVTEGSKDPNKSCKFYTSTLNFATEKLHYWRDALSHPCHPLEACMEFWPQKPPTYRKVIGSYVGEMRKLGNKILELICEGLGLRPEYLNGELSEKTLLIANHYPVCPDPSLTLGLTKHIDPSLITFLFQRDVPGLQVFKDGGWIGVQSIPHAFVVNVGYILRVISNGKLNAAEHRVVTNSKVPRTTVAYFLHPSDESLIEPAKGIFDGVANHPRYKPFKYKEFNSIYVAYSADAKILEDFLSIKK